MKIAIIGSGISGNTLAWHLHKQHDITLYEANSHIGGHSHTHDIHHQDEQHTIDSGFIVFNYKTYPNFIQMLESLEVPVKKSNMSFSVKCESSGLEYNGNNLNSLFAQRRNLFRPAFHRMIRDILRFNKESIDWLASNSNSTLGLGEYLTMHNYSEAFIEYYIIPMGSAIWSSSYTQMMDFPAQFFIRFFANHGLLSVTERPDWYVIDGGSRAYVEKLVSGFRHRIRLNSPVKQVLRTPSMSRYIVNQVVRKFTTMSFSPVTVIRHWLCCNNRMTSNRRYLVPSPTRKMTWYCILIAHCYPGANWPGPHGTTTAHNAASHRLRLPTT